VRKVTAQPGYALSDVTALLASGQFVWAECFTIAPLEGPVMRFTDVQEDVSIVGWNDVSRYSYKARDVILTGLRARSTIGVEVDEQDISIAYSDSSLFQTWLPWPQALLQGRLDGATVSRDRALASAFGAPWIGVTRMFSGQVSSLDAVGRTISHFKVKSGLERLNIQMPRDLYVPTCKNVWGDTRCGVNQSDFAALGTIGASPTRTSIPWASSAASYAGGKIHITNTDSVTRVRSILRADATHLTLTYPLDFDPVAGMEFTAYPGCPRTMTGCQVFHGATWMNFFAGAPFVPVAETAL